MAVLQMALVICCYNVARTVGSKMEWENGSMRLWIAVLFGLFGLPLLGILLGRLIPRFAMMICRGDFILQEYQLNWIVGIVDKQLCEIKITQAGGFMNDFNGSDGRKSMISNSSWQTSLNSSTSHATARTRERGPIQNGEAVSVFNYKPAFVRHSRHSSIDLREQSERTSDGIAGDAASIQHFEMIKRPSEIE